MVIGVISVDYLILGYNFLNIIFIVIKKMENIEKDIQIFTCRITDFSDHDRKNIETI